MFERTVSALLAPCCTAVLLACVPAADGSPPPARSTALDGERSVPVPSSKAIAGEWDIVSFMGHEPRRLQGTMRAAYADFRAEGVALKIECNSSGVAGDVQSGRFIARPGDRVQTAMGCGPVREARDRALFDFFDRKPSVEQIDDDRLRLLAGNDVLILERPATRRLAFLPSAQELMGEWRLQEIARYHEAGGMSGIGLSELPGNVAIDGITVSYTPCPQYDLRYRYTEEGRLEKLDGTPLPAERLGCEALREEWRGRDMPVPWDALRVLHDDPLVELVDEDTILVSTERFGVLLTRISRL